MGFRQLSHSERAVVFAEDRRGSSQREIARLLGRSASTICRELLRGRASGSYCPERGFRAYERGRSRCRPRRKLVAGGALWRFVWHQLVTFRWSPEQIAATLWAMHPDDLQARVSHETIYAMIYAQIGAQPRGGLKAAMVAALRQGKQRQGLGRGIGRKPGGGGAIVPESLKIIHRPEEIDARLIPGHWPYGDWKTIAYRPLGGGHDQGGLQPLLGRHAGRAQNPFCHSCQDGGKRGRGRTGRLHPADETPPRRPHARA